MILQATLVGGWEKLELWSHTHLVLFALLVLVCVFEALLLKITTSAGLLTRPHHYDQEYDESGEYEEDIYSEDLSTDYDQGARQQVRYRHTQQEQERQIILQTTTEYPFGNYNGSNEENLHLLNNNYRSTSSYVFRFVH